MKKVILAVTLMIFMVGVSVETKVEANKSNTFAGKASVNKQKTNKIIAGKAAVNRTGKRT